MISLYKIFDSLIFSSRCACPFCGAEMLLDREACQECSILLKRCGDVTSVVNGGDGHFAAYIYDDISKKAIVKLKYLGKSYIGKQLGWQITLPESIINNTDIVIPVPLSAKRLKMRGYNQSYMIASGFAEKYSLKTSRTALFRVEDSKQQVKKNARERKAEHKNDFVASNEVEGKRLIIIDDVCTTGSTLANCVKSCKEKGAIKVFTASVCYTEIITDTESLIVT